MSTRPPSGEPPYAPDKPARPARGRRILWLVRAAAGVTLLSALAWLARTPVGPVPEAAAPAATAPSQAPSGRSPDSGRAPSPAEPTYRGERAIYRWRDADGALHLSSEPPPSGIRAEALRLQAGPQVPDRNPPGAAATVLPAPLSDPLSDPLSVYTPQGLRALAERLAETHRRLEERERLLETLRLEAGR